LCNANVLKQHLFKREKRKNNNNKKQQQQQQQQQNNNKNNQTNNLELTRYNTTHVRYGTSKIVLQGQNCKAPPPQISYGPFLIQNFLVT